VQEASGVNFNLIMNSLFVLAILAVAFRTGRVYYGSIVTRLLYVERSRRPAIFWLLIAFYICVGVMASEFIWAGRISN
jgi:hypothetical protein